MDLRKIYLIYLKRAIKTPEYKLNYTFYESHTKKGLLGKKKKLITKRFEYFEFIYQKYTLFIIYI